MDKDILAGIFLLAWNGEALMTFACSVCNTNLYPLISLSPGLSVDIKKGHGAKTTSSVLPMSCPNVSSTAVNLQLHIIFIDISPDA